MRRGLRLIRGMIGMGVTFAAGVGAAVAAFGLYIELFRTHLTAHAFFGTVGRFAVVGFIVGVGFSGILALVARRRSFDRLSLPLVTGLGAGAGVLYWLAIGMHAFSVWSVRAALGNLAVLSVMGAGAAAATLLIARRAGRALGTGRSPASLGEGDPPFRSATRRREKAEV